jgi:nicotinamide mononucleotide transporter
VETFAAVTGLASVVLTVRQSVWCWPIGIISSAAYIFVFRDSLLYADMVLQGMFIASSALGWWRWQYPDHGAVELPVSRTSAAEGALVGLGAVAAALAWGGGLAWQTNAALPWVDAGNAAISVAAQWLLTRKKLETWPLWLATDICQVGVYYYKDLWKTSLLYAVFCGLAAVGFVAWWRELRSPTAVTAANAT